MQGDGRNEAFALYKETRLPRVQKVQRISAENSFLRTPTDPSWVFGYDAVTVPLGASAIGATGSVPAQRPAHLPRGDHSSTSEVS
jgi:hypothetical protein